MRKLEILIVGDERDFRRSLDETEKSTHKLGKAAIAAGIGIAGSLVVGLKKSVDAAERAQVVQARMEGQLHTLGISYQKHAGHIDKVIEKTMKLSAFDDEDLKNSFSQLVRTTGDVNKALADQALAADIARAKNISLEAATALVTKAELGKAGALTRAGIEVDKNATKLELLDTLQKKFAGSAEAYGKTAAGGQERFRVAIENLQETIGTALLPIISKLGNFLADLTDKVSHSEAAHKALKIIQDALATAWDIAKETVKKLSQVVEDHRATFEKLGRFLRDDIVPIVRFVFEKVLPVAIDIAITAIDKIITAIAGIITAGRNVVVFFKDLPGNIADAITNGLGTIKRAITGVFGHVIDWVKETLGIKSPSAVFAEIGENVVKGFIKGIGSTAGLLASAVKRMVMDLIGRLGSSLGFGPTDTGGIQTGIDPEKYRNLVALGHRLQSMGFDVSEHPAFGGVHDVHAPNSWHYKGRAIDVNWPGGGPVELSHLRAVFGMISALHPIEEMIEDAGSVNQHLHVAMAKGGIVTRPMFPLVGEAGPEAVIPLDRFSGLGGITIYVNVGTAVGDDKTRIARDIGEHVEREIIQRARGGSALGAILRAGGVPI